MGIGKRIKEARKLKGLTQTELATMIGVTPSAITNYENETSHPKEPVLYKLFEALGCDANFLFQDEIKNSPEPAITDSRAKQEEEVYQILKKAFSELNIDIGSLTDRQKVILDVLADMIARNF